MARDSVRHTVGSTANKQPSLLTGDPREYLTSFLPWPRSLMGVVGPDVL